MFTFAHFNFNVFDLDKSLKFYREALGLTPVREKTADDGSFKIVFLGDGATDFELELTWLRDRAKPYNLGDLEYHLALTADDFDAAYTKHQAMASSATRIRRWGSILYPIRTDTGSRSSRSGNPTAAFTVSRQSRPAPFTGTRALGSGSKTHR